MNAPLATDYIDSLVPCPCGYPDCYSTYITSRSDYQWEPCVWIENAEQYEKRQVIEYGPPPHVAKPTGRYVYRRRQP